MTTVTDLHPKGLEAAAAVIAAEAWDNFTILGAGFGPITLTRKAISAYLEAAEPASPWMPIESAPKDGTQILAHGLDDQDHRRWGVIYWYEGRWLGGHFNSHGRPTHWMPLPEAPRQGA